VANTRFCLGWEKSTEYCLIWQNYGALTGKNLTDGEFKTELLKVTLAALNKPLH
jgi:hypothetical protein